MYYVMCVGFGIHGIVNKYIWCALQLYKIAPKLDKLHFKWPNIIVIYIYIPIYVDGACILFFYILRRRIPDAASDTPAQYNITNTTCLIVFRWYFAYIIKYILYGFNDIICYYLLTIAETACEESNFFRAS